jgi:hypothetical protein
MPLYSKMIESEILKLPQGTPVKIKGMDKPYNKGVLVFQSVVEFNNEFRFGIKIEIKGIKANCFEFEAEKYELI